MIMTVSMHAVVTTTFDLFAYTTLLLYIDEQAADQCRVDSPVISAA